MRKMMKGRKMVAGLLTLVVAFTFSMSGVRVNAAEKQDATYIKDFKLYIAENSKAIGTYDEETEAKKAKEWFENNGYKMIEGNLNADASGNLKKEVGVYMGYSTTTDVKEAVTDLAVMNERGNYSEGEYKRILEEQKKMYTDMVSDLKTMLEEYRTNVNNGVSTAIQARDFMNGYVDDDTNEKLGDRLMTISDEDLGTLLMQANGQVVLMIEERLSYACDTGKTTWLDRMTKLGSYDKLEKQALKACNNDITKANTALDKKYKDDAQTLADRWEDIRQHIIGIRTKVKDWGLDTKSEEEKKQFFEENQDNDEVNTFFDRYQILNGLASYTYEGKTLLDFFDQPAETFKGDGIRKLYPLAASLSDGQISAASQDVSLFTLVMNALGAGAFNDMESGETKKLMDSADVEDKKEAEETGEIINDDLNAWKQNSISIYEGVDREVFKGGVAVTSTAHSFNNGDGRTWADALVGSTVAKGIAIGTAAGAVIFATGAVVASRMISKAKDTIALAFFEDQSSTAYFMDRSMKKFKDVEVKFDQLNDYDRVYEALNGKQKNALYECAIEDGFGGKNPGTVLKINHLRYVRIGFTIASILLSVADIVATSITLYKYYNRDHLPIPSYMVDMSYNEEKQTSFINYKSVLNQDGGFGDVNGGGGKQWLALYETRDPNAGEPILAPENGESFKILVQYGSAEEPKTEGYTPLHLFGSPNTAQNLTFADGESGWSFNDGKKGTYVFFRRGAQDAIDDIAEEKVEESNEDKNPVVSGSAVDIKNIGTALHGGTLVLVGVLSGVCGIFIGVVGMTLMRRKKEETDEE